eukprot:GHVP01068258.1.p1 GENE.GHVP01068258.1~~GHVP01068258.1.p1  ORF type:complete len:147 (+),score=19.57 GHVP01068258.1:88-528(+)
MEENYKGSVSALENLELDCFFRLNPLVMSAKLIRDHVLWRNDRQKTFWQEMKMIIEKAINDSRLDVNVKKRMPAGIRIIKGSSPLFIRFREIIFDLGVLEDCLDQSFHLIKDFLKNLEDFVTEGFDYTFDRNNLESQLCLMWGKSP